MEKMRILNLELRKLLYLVLIIITTAIDVNSKTYLGNKLEKELKEKNIAVKAKKERCLVKEIRFWSDKNYTRVVVDIDGRLEFRYRLLKRDKSIDLPPRLYIDLINARISSSIREPILIENNLLKRIRAAQHTSEVVRIVLDIERIDNYRIFALEEPLRIIIDVYRSEKSGEEIKEIIEKEEKEVKEKGKGNADDLSAVIKKIVIDPGHGGKDSGAIGVNGLMEKDLVLDISLMLKEMIEKELGISAILTRDDDRYLSLEERTAIANIQNADIFISIHANSSPKRNTKGVETYFLSLTKDPEAMRVAARENAISLKKLDDLQLILNDLMFNSKIKESSTLASYIQKSIILNLNGRYSDVNDLGVKQAPFYVLIGAKMPSVLVEVSFISNPIEGKRLESREYRRKIARGILEGIKNYIEHTEMAYNRN